MNAIVQQSQFGALPSVFQGMVPDEGLSAGISAGYGHIGYKGKVWSIRYKGEERTLMREDGDGPRNSIELVIIKAPSNLSKIWYEKGYVEGSNEKPDCFSANGLTPDPSSPKKQHHVCATCPKNAFGTAVRQDGTPGKGKACNDSKRLAVVPAQDIRNEAAGGPMLLRVPAGSFESLSMFDSMLRKNGFPYFAVVARIAFDIESAYPKFVFTAVRPLTEAEARDVIGLRDDPRTARVTSEATDDAAVTASQPAPLFEQPGPVPQVVQAAPRMAPEMAPQAAPILAPQAAPPVQPVAPVQQAAPAPDPKFEADLDAELDALLK